MAKSFLTTKCNFRGGKPWEEAGADRPYRISVSTAGEPTEEDRKKVCTALSTQTSDSRFKDKIAVIFQYQADPKEDIYIGSHLEEL